MRQPLYIGIVWIAAWCGIVSAAAKKPAYVVPDSMQVLTFRGGEQVLKMQRVEGGRIHYGCDTRTAERPCLVRPTYAYGGGESVLHRHY